MKKPQMMTNNLKAAIGCLVLIAIIVSLSASPLGWKIEKQALGPVDLKDVVVVRKEGEPDYGPGPGVPVYKITVTSGFIPRQYELPSATSCLYNTEKRLASYSDVRWDVSAQVSEFGQSATVLEVFRESKTATLNVFAGIRYKPSPEARSASPVKVPEINQTEVYDQLLLFFQEAGTRNYAYVDCFNLKTEDFGRAIKIEVVK